MDREVTIETGISEFSRNIVDYATCGTMDPKFQELRDRVDRQIKYYDRIYGSLAAAFETPAKPRPRMTIADADRELRRQIGMHFPVWATLARRKLAARQKVMIVLDGLECCVHGQATGHRHKKTRKEVIRYADPLTGKPKRIALDPSKILIGEIRERR